jgi:hypothetical protein
VLHQVAIDDCAGDAVTIGYRSGASLREVRGTGNGGVGLRVRNGAQVVVDAVTDLTGAAGDVRVGGKPARTWADFRTAVPVGNEADFFDPATSDGSRLSQG